MITGVDHTKTLITGGCSFTLSPASWADCAADYLGCDLVNVAAGGAGNDYISRSMIEILECQRPDPATSLIMVMWSGVGRKDFAVSGEYWHWLDDYVCKSQMASQEESYWIHSGGLSSWTEHAGARHTFRSYYQSSDPNILCKDSLYSMIALENYLQNQGYQYWFMSYHNYWRDDQQSITTGEYTLGWFAKHMAMYQQLRFDRWLFLDSDKNSIFEFCQDRNLLGQDGFHPSPNGHLAWFDTVIKPRLSRKEQT